MHHPMRGRYHPSRRRRRPSHHTQQHDLHEGSNGRPAFPSEAKVNSERGGYSDDVRIVMEERLGKFSAMVWLGLQIDKQVKPQNFVDVIKVRP